jgi:hypothetical protein
LLLPWSLLLLLLLLAAGCRFIDGYTIRTVGLKSLILQDVAPPLEEISRFNAAGQSEADDMNVRGWGLRAGICQADCAGSLGSP